MEEEVRTRGKKERTEARGIIECLRVFIVRENAEGAFWKQEGDI